MENKKYIKLEENLKENNNILNKNLSTLEDYHHLNLNFKKLLNKKESLIFKNCSNILINIDNDINRIEFYNCSNITLTQKKLLGGIFSKNSDIEILFSNNIYNLEIENSIIKLPKNIYKKISFIQKFKSKIFIQ